MVNKQSKWTSSIVDFFNIIISKLKKKKVQRQMSVFFVCFIISLTIWLFIKLSYDYTTSISYPVKFVNLSKEMGLTSELPEKLTLVVHDKGSQLLKYKFLNSFDDIIIDASRIAIKRSKNGYQSIYSSKDFLNDIKYQTQLNKNLIAVKPDSIVLSYEKYISKEVPVTSLIHYEIPQEFWLSEPVEIEPKYVKVSAFQSVIDTLKTIYTEKKDLGIVQEVLHTDVPLQRPKGIKCNIEPAAIHVTIPSKRFTEKEIQIPIELKTQLKENIKIFPSKLTVTFLVSFDDYARIKSNMFSAVISVKDINKKSIPVELLDYPKFIQLKKIEPEEVEIMIVE